MDQECPVCIGRGELVCTAPEKPGHDHMFIRDTTVYWCEICMGKGRIIATANHDTNEDT